MAPNSLLQIGYSDDQNGLNSTDGLVMSKALTVPKLSTAKRSSGADPLVMVTAYDAPSARVASEAAVDIVLVGDSVAMVVMGYNDTLQVSVEDMCRHTEAVARAQPKPLIVTDMPWMSFHVSKEAAVLNAAELVRAGANCVKLEGGVKRLPVIESILAAEIPVMAHVGLTPQSTNMMGGFKVQGRNPERAEQLVEAAIALEAAGCCALVVEGVPSEVGKAITDAISIPTIGIGAGPDTDGQVLVFHDIIGLENRFKPKFVRRYGTAFEDQTGALKRFADDVRQTNFPGSEETYDSDEPSVKQAAPGQSPVSIYGPK